MLRGAGQVVRSPSYLCDYVGQRDYGLIEGVLGGAEHTRIVGLDRLGQIAPGQALHHPDDVVEAGVYYLGNVIDAFPQCLEEAALAGQIHAAVQLALDHCLHYLRHFPLDSDLFGAIRPLDHGSQPLAIVAEHRVGDEGEGAPAEQYLGLVGVVQLGQHAALMAGIFVEAVDVGTHQGGRVEAVELFFNVGFGLAQHCPDRLVHVDDVEVCVGNHHVGSGTIERLLDPQAFGGGELGRCVCRFHLVFDGDFLGPVGPLHH